ncbi:MAG: hypothetical protein ACTIDH_05300 [Lactobacillus sp.]
MAERFEFIFYWISKKSFFRVAQRTFITLMPLLLIGVMAQTLMAAFIGYDSWLYNISYAYQFIPTWLSDNVLYLLNSVRFASFNLAGLLVAYLTAGYTAKLFHKDAQMAGITSVLTLLIASYNGNQPATVTTLPFNAQLLDMNMVLLPFLLGYLVGNIFRWLAPRQGHKRFEQLAGLDVRVWQAVKPMLVALVIGLLLALGVYLFKTKISNAVFNSLISTELSTNNILKGVGLALLITLLALIGIVYPVVALNNSNNSGAAVANMNNALIHSNSWRVPYKYLGSELYTGYASLSSSVTLALIITVLLVMHNRYKRRLAGFSLFPAMFGVPTGFLAGLPVLFNPVYLLPILIVVTFNMLLSALLLWLNWIPAVAFPVLVGTPQPIAPFVATNGSWRVLVYSIILLVIDVCWFRPWVKLDMKIQERVANDEKE